MAENKPEETLHLHQAGKLGMYLDQKYSQALDAVLRMKERGMSEDQAFEVAQSEILAPSEPLPNPRPTPLPSRVEQQILRSLTS
jgi:hypothetical protein